MLISIKIARGLGFLGSVGLECCFPLINVKMPTIVGILKFMSEISCSVELDVEGVL